MRLVGRPSLTHAGPVPLVSPVIIQDGVGRLMLV
jgi:hypothetical protein